MINKIQGYAINQGQNVGNDINKKQSQISFGAGSYYLKNVPFLEDVGGSLIERKEMTFLLKQIKRLGDFSFLERFDKIVDPTEKTIEKIDIFKAANGDSISIPAVDADPISLVSPSRHIDFETGDGNLTITCFPSSETYLRNFPTEKEDSKSLRDTRNFLIDSLKEKVAEKGLPAWLEKEA